MDFDLEPGFAEAPLAYAPPPSLPGRDRLDRLRLIRSRRVGPATFRRLMAEYGTATKALEALPEVAARAGAENYSICPEGVALAEMKAARRAGATMLCLGDDEYPRTLTEVGQSPPVLWAIGDLSLLAKPTIAVVGTRNASSLGARMATKLAKDLGEEGFVVVSGLARGIDAIAHHASLDTGTIAVHAGGLDVMYPAENTELAERIGEHGLRISEQPFGLDPQARHFPLRNRIVSGLACAVLVVEAAARSGSLITARAALDQGRDVLAVPGHPLDSRASGCNLLIRDGATLVRSVDDVLETLNPLVEAEPAPVETEAAPQRAKSRAELTNTILDLLGPAPIPEDQVIRDCGEAAETVTARLLELEFGGQIERRPGGMLAKAV